MGFILRVIDENGNEIPFNRIKANNSTRYSDNIVFEEITIQISDKKDIFTDEDIDLIRELLLDSLNDGGTYKKMKKIMELIDKLNEENTINE